MYLQKSDGYDDLCLISQHWGGLREEDYHELEAHETLPQKNQTKPKSRPHTR